MALVTRHATSTRPQIREYVVEPSSPSPTGSNNLWKRIIRVFKIKKNPENRKRKPKDRSKGNNENEENRRTTCACFHGYSARNSSLSSSLTDVERRESLYSLHSGNISISSGLLLPSPFIPNTRGYQAKNASAGDLTMHWREPATDDEENSDSEFWDQDLRVPKEGSKSLSSSQRIPSAESEGTKGPQGSLQEWVIASDLVKVLSHYPKSKLTFSMLWDNHRYPEEAVRKCVSHHKKLFVINVDEVDLKPEISICSDHLHENGCQDTACEDLHICPVDLEGNCHREFCPLGHSLHTDHNLKAIHLCLQSLPDKQLRDVIRYAVMHDVSRTLEICNDYNQNSCKGLQCKKLHICETYIRNLANCTQPFCHLNHSFKEASVEKLLEAISISTDECPKDIVIEIQKVCPQIEDNPFPETKNTPDKTYKSTDEYGDNEITEICADALAGCCPNEDSGCNFLHCDNDYHWQLKDFDGRQINFTPNGNSLLENAYCDPGQDTVEISQHSWQDMHLNENLAHLLGTNIWEANFEPGMRRLTLSCGDKDLELRRLCVKDTSNRLKREFVWYYQGTDGKYIEFGKNDPSSLEEFSGICSSHLEGMFSENLAEGTSLHLRTDRHTFCIEIDTMTLEDESDHTIWNVRRRPRGFGCDTSSATPTGSDKVLREIVSNWSVG